MRTRLDHEVTSALMVPSFHARCVARISGADAWVKVAIVLNSTGEYCRAVWPRWEPQPRCIDQTVGAGLSEVTAWTANPNFS